MDSETMKCFIIAKNSKTEEDAQRTIYRSLLSLIENDVGVVYLNWKLQRVCRNISFEYKLSDLVGLCTDFMSDGKVTLCFQNPRQELLVNADRLDLSMFLAQLNDLINSRHLDIALDGNINPEFSNIIALEHFYRQNLNAKYLTALVLENCVISYMPVDLGNLPISYLSLTSCTINTSRERHNTFWNWMSEDTIRKTLTTLKMNSVGLKVLPFEMIYLNKLQTLSLAKNNLVSRLG